MSMMRDLIKREMSKQASVAEFLEEAVTTGNRGAIRHNTSARMNRSVLEGMLDEKSGLANRVLKHRERKNIIDLLNNHESNQFVEEKAETLGDKAIEAAHFLVNGNVGEQTDMISNAISGGSPRALASAKEIRDAARAIVSSHVMKNTGLSVGGFGVGIGGVGVGAGVAAGGVGALLGGVGQGAAGVRRGISGYRNKEAGLLTSAKGFANNATKAVKGFGEDMAIRGMYAGDRIMKSSAEVRKMLETSGADIIGAAKANPNAVKTVAGAGVAIGAAGIALKKLMAHRASVRAAASAVAEAAPEIANAASAAKSNLARNLAIGGGVGSMGGLTIGVATRKRRD